MRRARGVARARRTSARVGAGIGAALLTAIACAPAPASAQTLDGRVRVSTSVDTTLVTVGDRITLRVSIEHPADAVVAWPDTLDLTPFELIDARILDARPAAEDGGRSVSELVLVVSAFELGELELPSFELPVVGVDGETEIVETDAFGVEVVTVGADETGDIREIRGPVSLPVGLLGIVLPLLLVLLGALLAWVAMKRMRRRDDVDTPVARAPPPRPAHEIALEALADLEASPMLERGQVKEYHIRVSDIIRTYVERRFRVDALEMTSREVLDGLTRAGVDPNFREGLRRFLEQCDLVKFAKVRPDAERSREVLATGRRLVEQSIPAVPVPDVDQEPA